MPIEYGTPPFDLPADVAFVDKFQVFTQEQIFSEGLQAISPNGNNRISNSDAQNLIEGRLGLGGVQFLTGALNADDAISSILVLPAAAAADVVVTFSNPVAVTDGTIFLLINLSTAHRITLAGNAKKIDGTAPDPCGPGQSMQIQKVGDGTGAANYFVIAQTGPSKKATRASLNIAGGFLSPLIFNGVQFTIQDNGGVGGTYEFAVQSLTGASINMIISATVISATGALLVTSNLPATTAAFPQAAPAIAAIPNAAGAMVTGTIDLGINANRRVFSFGASLKNGNAALWVEEFAGPLLTGD